jgi:hypothetical protein
MKRLVFLCLYAIGSIRAQQLVEIDEPSADRWMYSFNSTPGSRPAGSVFSALPSSNSGVSDRFGQIIIRFSLAKAGIPTQLGAANYRVRRLVLRATVYSDRGFRYDGTADSWQSVLFSSTHPDADLGRPVELFGVGFRNGWTASSFQENSAHGGSAPGTRNAFALGFDPSANSRDVSDNVSQGFDPLPWAIGTCVLSPGTLVPEETVMTFSVDLSRPGVHSYITQGMNAGFIWLSLSSLHPAIQQGGEFADFHLKESPVHELLGGFAPTLELEYEIPHPSPRLTRNPQTQAVTLQWQGLPTYSYVIQRSPDLTPGSWTTRHTTTFASSQNAQWQETHAPTRAFYRIIRTKL